MISRSRLERLTRDLGAILGEPSPDARRCRARRRRMGAYFTPAPLVEFVAEATIAARLKASAPTFRADGSPRLCVLDPAAGDGRFLAAAADVLVRLAVGRGADEDRVRRAIIKRCVVGIERDPQFAELARARLGPGSVLHCTEALLQCPSSVRDLDVVIGNPPYVRSIRLGETDAELRTALRGRYAATSHGEWDLYAAFIEQSLSWTNELGEVGLVVPSRWLTAAFAARLRDKLATARAIRGVVDFGAHQIFEGATTYASVAFLSRRGQDRVSVSRLRETWVGGNIPASSLDAAPWRLSVGARRSLLDALCAGGRTLGGVARIAKGTGTNADRVYVFEGEVPDVEPALLRTCVRGRDIRAFSSPDPGVRILVPYCRQGQLVPPERLARDYPRAAAHFDRHRDILESRERGRFRGTTYYQYGRPQNLAYLSLAEAKLIVPDVARAGRGMIDVNGAMVLDSAYAIRPHAGSGVSIELLCAVINSRVVAHWLRETGVPLRGNYVRMKTAYLTSLPLPSPSPASERAEAAVRDGDAIDPDEIDELVRSAYGISRDDWDL